MTDEPNLTDADRAALEKATAAHQFGDLISSRLNRKGRRQLILRDPEYARKDAAGRQILGLPPLDDEEDEEGANTQ